MSPLSEHDRVGDEVNDLLGHLNWSSHLLHLHGVGHQEATILNVPFDMVTDTGMP